ncbi:outer membrane efflux protein [Bacteriovorax sp. BSW11_IV]|uniref:TolC family protein n=1 Tax=Bacteriovorax sp. BSW11_IV TaxID=1353529 RepID=UPI00038A547E|nr:TolC family protein [Bacteriovorax sp. BSW11_IV]EQC42949.1 outer membrane efflux protein [Bacteriovorax sp. BSW11_IV]
MKLALATCSLLLVTLSANALEVISYEKATQALNNHEIVQGGINRAAAISAMGEMEGSWGDPVLKLGIKNLPKDSLAQDVTPMSGIDIGLSQKIALTTKYGNLRRSFEMESKSALADSMEAKEVLLRDLWNLLLDKKQVGEDLKVIGENKNWIQKMLAVSKKLYSNGKIGQAALFDIQIRKNDIETSIAKLELKNKELDAAISYYIGEEKEIDLKSVPWKKIAKESKSQKDNRLEKFENKLKGREYDLSAKRLNYIPDINVGLTYTKRENLDGKGDFVGASISFPLPFSDKTSSAHEQSAKMFIEAKTNLNNYKIQKQSAIQRVHFEILQLEKELEILVERTLDQARSSRDVTAKSYGLGSATYFELLKSEIQWQDVQLKKNMLTTKLLSKKIQLKYLRGDSLYEL